jgi:hypothetical protein
MGPRTVIAVAALAALTGVAAGCGGSATSSAPPSTATTSSAPSTASPPTPPKPTSAGPGALQAEAASAATGDIPDNQVFVVFRDGAAGYSIKYPEGWAQQGSGPRVSFHDKNNIVRILVRRGSVSVSSVGRELRGLSRVRVTQQPQQITIGDAPVVKGVYTTVSAPNPVTGKRVTLTVDRYYLTHGGKEAIVDLGTPVGVDNVDAYRLMVESFRWR